jgi:hypothetical protein
MRLFADQYLFEGNDDENENEDPETIYMEFNVKDLLMGMKFFNKDADVARIKLVKDNFPQLRINAQMNAELEKSPKYRTEIPVIIVPKEKWQTFPVPNELQFNTVMKSPRFGILRKYVDIFKNFKYIHFTFRKNALQLLSDEIGSTVSTTFDNAIYIEHESSAKADVVLDARKLSLFFSSITSLNSIKVCNLTLAVTHQKMMKMYFQNEMNSISFHYVIASKAHDQDEDDEEVESNKENNSNDDL